MGREREKDDMEVVGFGVKRKKSEDEERNLSRERSSSSADESTFQSNRIQVSNVKKPLFFYVNLAQRLLGQFEVLEFSALGLAISTLVTVVEILRQNQLAEITRVHTSTVNAQESHEGDFKAKMEVTVKRSSTYQQMKPGDEEEGK